jgi:hypothetical protein
VPNRDNYPNAGLTAWVRIQSLLQVFSFTYIVIWAFFSFWEMNGQVATLSRLFPDCALIAVQTG